MKRIAVGGFAVLAVLAGCVEGKGAPRSSGSLAVSNDSQFLFAADTDNGILAVLRSDTLVKVADVKVGVSPFRVAVGADDAVYVANRGSRSISVIRSGDWQVAAEVPTGVDPVGLQVSSDGKTLYFVSSTASDTAAYGTLTAVDTATLQAKWELPVGDEPRGLALVNDDRAVISLYRAGDLVTVDLKNAKVVRSSTDIYTRANAAALTTVNGVAGRAGAPQSFHPRAMTDVAVTPDGSRIFAIGLLSREAPILVPPSPVAPYYKAQGPRLAGSVATPAVFTVTTAGGDFQPLVDDVGATVPVTYGQTNSDSQKDYPQTSFATSGAGGTTVLQGPSVAVVDVTGDWLYVVNKESSNVAVISIHKRNAKDEPQSQDPYTYSYSPYGKELPSVHSTAKVGPGADGIAILGDNRSAYVYSQFDHSVRRLTLKNDRSGIDSQSPMPIATDTLDAVTTMGRKLFHDANHRGMSAVEASVACSSCHLEGRDDSHVWMFPDGPRQTPTLAGRGTLQTQPYHWSGEFPTIEAFMNHTITSRMGGKGLQPFEASAIDAFMGEMKAPENPYQKEELSDAVLRGAAVFQRAECGSCHSGQWLTNGANANVGTLVTSGFNPDNGLVMGGLNVPSLKGLARSAPYLHDGSAHTLRERITGKNELRSPDLHGKTSTLTPQDVDDLVAYLQTL